MKKVIPVLVVCMFLITLSLNGVSAKAEGFEFTDDLDELNLENIDLAELNSGKEFILEDGTIIKKYSWEEAAKIIAEQNGESEADVLRRIKPQTSKQNKSTVTANSSCATGAVPIMRNVKVTSSYQPLVYVWTELCANSKNQYVIESIVDISLDRNYKGIVKGFGGSVVAKSLNAGKTLYYRVEGTFYNNATTTTGLTVGMNTPSASISYNASTTSNYYGYVHQADNIVLYSN